VAGGPGREQERQRERKGERKEGGNYVDQKIK
jgi:hypothetical protein